VANTALLYSSIPAFWEPEAPNFDFLPDALVLAWDKHLTVLMLPSLFLMIRIKDHNVFPECAQEKRVDIFFHFSLVTSILSPLGSCQNRVHQLNVSEEAELL
jgi:hypothetical protein